MPMAWPVLLLMGMKTYTFLLLMMIWFLSLQAMADGMPSETVRSGSGGSRTANQAQQGGGGSNVASSKDEQVALAKACIKEAEGADKTAWPRAFMDLRQKWVSTELACAPKQVSSIGGKACVEEDGHASTPKCTKTIDVPSQIYSASNGVYARFLQTHHNLIMKAQSLATPSQAGEADAATKYRQQINSSNCEKLLPEYYRAMAYTGDEVEWHIGYALKKDGKCSKGPSEPPVILEERSQKIAAAVEPFLKNKGALEREGTWFLSGKKSTPTKSPVAIATVARNDLPLQAADGTCAKPNYEEVATKFLNTRAWVYNYAQSCWGQPGVSTGTNRYFEIHRQLNGNLERAYATYMQSQKQAVKPIFTTESAIHFNTLANKPDSTMCQSNRAAFDQITNLSPGEYKNRLESSSCNATHQVAAVPTS